MPLILDLKYCGGINIFSQSVKLYFKNWSKCNTNFIDDIIDAEGNFRAGNIPKTKRNDKI